MSPTSERVAQAAYSVAFRSPARYVSRANHLFQGVPLQGRNVLEIGCGAGAWALWSALNGARHVVGLEPEADGLIPGTAGAFERNIRSLDLSDVIEAQRLRLQDFKSTERFDLVILNNTINHLDEEAVQRLGFSGEARQKFIEILAQIHFLTAPQGVVIVTDCSRYNLWPSLNLKSPFCPTIEWQKHQSPRVWTRLFEAAHFELMDLRWSPSYPLGVLTANFLISYITVSHFVLRFRRR